MGLKGGKDDLDTKDARSIVTGSRSYVSSVASTPNWDRSDGPLAEPPRVLWWARRARALIAADTPAV
jgi:hypothetical protein